jgi:hypothetical protein
MSTAPTRTLGIVGRSAFAEPRSARLQSLPVAGSRDAAYRRLTATILGLDVATLAAELSAARLSTPAARAA